MTSPICSTKATRAGRTSWAPSTTLQRWEHDHEETAAVLPAVTLSGVAPERSATADSVIVTAIPAGAGDCILVEYRDEDAILHRVLIDGGLGTSFDTGLGAYARAQPGGRLDVDVLVVTHIDNDHIVGAVKALEQGLLTAQDVWFNGLAELDQLDTRAPKQGDQLSALVPAEQRNRVVEGAALHVPDTGSLPVLTLPGGARCTLLTPNRARLDKLRDRWKATAARGTAVGIEDLEARIDQQDLGRAQPGFGKDTSVTNASSIAFVFEHGTTTALFTGDAFAGDLSDGLDRLLRERHLTRLSGRPVQALPPRQRQQHHAGTARTPRRPRGPGVHGRRRSSPRRGRRPPPRRAPRTTAACGSPAMARRSARPPSSSPGPRSPRVPPRRSSSSDPSLVPSEPSAGLSSVLPPW